MELHPENGASLAPYAESPIHSINETTEDPEAASTKTRHESLLPTATTNSTVANLVCKNNSSGSAHIAAQPFYANNNPPAGWNGSYNKAKPSTSSPSQFQRGRESPPIDPEWNSQHYQKTSFVPASGEGTISNGHTDAATPTVDDLPTSPAESSRSGRFEIDGNAKSPALSTDTPPNTAHTSQTKFIHNKLLDSQYAGRVFSSNLPKYPQSRTKESTTDMQLSTVPMKPADEAVNWGHNDRRKPKENDFKARRQGTANNGSRKRLPSPSHSYSALDQPINRSHGVGDQRAKHLSEHHSPTAQPDHPNISEHRLPTTIDQQPYYYQQQENVASAYPMGAISFLQELKRAFHHRPDKYNQFIDIMRAARSSEQPISQTIASASELFRGYPWLISGFNHFVPQGYQIANPSETNGFSISNRKDVDFNLAVRFVHFAKQRLKDSPGLFTQFQRVLQGFEKGQLTTDDVLSKVEELFQDDPVLLNEFLKFMPIENVQGDEDWDHSNSFGDGLQHHHKRQRISNPECPISLGQENAAFFAHVRVFLGNDQTYSLFLKVINLFNQGMVDRESTVRKASDFLRGDPRLLDKFKELLGYQDGRSGKRCRGHMQHLSAKANSGRRKSKMMETQRCSGRDDLCNEVLNDEFASHPIWASEDGGFIASKKNQFEEALHKVEEQRYELDRLIDSGTHLLGLLNRILDNMRTLSTDQLRNYRAPQYLGARTESAYKVAIQKLYNKDADKTLALLYANPSQAIPAVLKLLQSKLDEWRKKKANQDKAWKESEAENFYKALDSRCATFKNTDKRALSIKSLVTEIEGMRFEQQETNGTNNSPQLVLEFASSDIITDIEDILNIFNTNRVIYSESVIRNIRKFFATFVHPFMKVNPSVQDDGKVNGFLANDTLYCFFRLYQILYERLETMKAIASEYDNDPEGTKKSCRAQIDTSLRETQYHGIALNFGDGYYTTMLGLIKQLLTNSIDQSTFEACMRYIFGLKSYVLFTVDKLLFALSHQAYIAVTDPKSRELVDLYRSDEDPLPEANLMLLLPYRLKAEDTQKDDGHLYALFIYVPSETKKITLSITMLESIYKEGKKEARKYYNYVQYFKSLSDDSGARITSNVRRPFLKRNMKEYQDVRVEAGQEYKICQNTYKMFYVIGTEDYLEVKRGRQTL